MISSFEIGVIVLVRYITIGAGVRCNLFNSGCGQVQGVGGCWSEAEKTNSLSLNLLSLQYIKDLIYA